MGYFYGKFIVRFEAQKDLVPIYFHCMEESSVNILPKFSFICSTDERKPYLQVWNDINLSKQW